MTEGKRVVSELSSAEGMGGGTGTRAAAGSTKVIGKEKSVPMSEASNKGEEISKVLTLRSD